MVRLLLDAGVDNEISDSPWDETPLLKAASAGSTGFILSLLEREANPHITDLVGGDMLNHRKLHQQGNEMTVGAIQDWLEGRGKNLKSKRPPRHNSSFEEPFFRSVK